MKLISLLKIEVLIDMKVNYEFNEEYRTWKRWLYKFVYLECGVFVDQESRSTELLPDVAERNS